MKKTLLILSVYLSLLLLTADAVFIFSMSAQDAVHSDQTSTGITETAIDVIYPEYDSLPEAEQQTIKANVHHAVRKTAHFTEFAALGFFTAMYTVMLGRAACSVPGFRLFGLKVRKNGGRANRLTVYRSAVPLSFLFCVLYASSDEAHQLFVSERGPSVSDVLLDSAGACFGIAVFLVIAAICFKYALRRAGQTVKR